MTLSVPQSTFVVVVITDLNLDKINHNYNHGVLHYVLNVLSNVLLGKLKYLTMTETNRVWMPDTFFQVSSHCFVLIQIRKYSYVF